MRKIVCFLFLVAMMLCTVGCSAESSSAPTEPSLVLDDTLLGFETVYSIFEKATVGTDEYNKDAESGVWVYYLREKLTDTMYVWRTTGRYGDIGGYSYWSSGMTVLMDPANNGPMTYDAFLQYIDNLEENNG